jgi:hypothetical protein
MPVINSKVWSPESGFKEEDNGEYKSTEGINVTAMQQFYR